MVNKLCERDYEVIGLDNINSYYDVQLKYSRLKEAGISLDETENNVLIESSKFWNYKFIRTDLTNEEVLKDIFVKFNFDCVINLAAQAGVRYSIENPSSYIQSNLVGFANILEMCRNYKVKHLLFASSSSVYGNSSEVPFKETDQVDAPVSLYAATKKSNELMAYTYSHLYDFQVTGLRFFTVYGPWGRPDMAPMLFADAISENRAIKVFNNGKMLRDFTYIGDIVEGLMNCITYKNEKTPRYEIFNIGNSKPVELMLFIKNIEDALGIKAKMDMLPMQPGDVKVTYADTTNLLDKTGYKPKVELSEGLNVFINWYKSYYKN